MPPPTCRNTQRLWPIKIHRECKNARVCQAGLWLFLHVFCPVYKMCRQTSLWTDIRDRHMEKEETERQDADVWRESELAGWLAGSGSACFSACTPGVPRWGDPFHDVRRNKELWWTFIKLRLHASPWLISPATAGQSCGGGLRLQLISNHRDIFASHSNPSGPPHLSLVYSEP